MIAWLFFIFWIRSNIFRDFLSRRRSILISEMIIKFVFPLALQNRIRNCSTAKTREEIAKRKRKVENDGNGGRDVEVEFLVYHRSSAYTFLAGETLQAGYALGFLIHFWCIF